MVYAEQQGQTTHSYLSIQITQQNTHDSLRRAPAVQQLVMVVTWWRKINSTLTLQGQSGQWHWRTQRQLR